MEMEWNANNSRAYLTYVRYPSLREVSCTAPVGAVRGVRYSPSLSLENCIGRYRQKVKKGKVRYIHIKKLLFFFFFSH